jgi:hypothetical protein
VFHPIEQLLGAFLALTMMSLPVAAPTTAITICILLLKSAELVSGDDYSPL